MLDCWKRAQNAPATPAARVNRVRGDVTGRDNIPFIFLCRRRLNEQTTILLLEEDCVEEENVLKFSNEKLRNN